MLKGIYPVDPFLHWHLEQLAADDVFRDKWLDIWWKLPCSTARLCVIASCTYNYAIAHSSPTAKGLELYFQKSRLGQWRDCGMSDIPDDRAPIIHDLSARELHLCVALVR
ncbi:hypothetical protein, partial [Erythrobacter sp. YJ-T3-07]|uniref:hypothetical protein n=1 Tax=Erythrobacter sp. YJ-T3-07 TaxID=2793063 RepID=UPI001F1AB6CE